jgi:ABC-type microcin C transport system duplicated ATPase subunit YejF
MIPNTHILFQSVDLGGLNAKRRRKLLGHRIGAVFQDPFTALDPAHAASIDPIGEQGPDCLPVHVDIAVQPVQALDKAT